MEEIRDIDENSSEHEKILRDVEGFALRTILRVHSFVDKQKSKNKSKGFKKKKLAFISDNFTLEKLREYVWPLAESLSDSEATFKRTLEMAHGTYGDILFRQTVRAEEFSENNFHIEYFMSGGDFEYYNRKYGLENASGIALYSAQFLQPKKKGDFDVKPKTRAEIEELWAFVENLSLKQKDLIGERCQNYYPDDVERFLKIIPQAIEYFTEKGNPEYLDYYLELCSVHVRLSVKDDAILPILDIPYVFEELESLSELGELKESGFSLAKIFMNRVSENITFKKDIAECREKERYILLRDKQNVEHHYLKLSIPDLIENFRSSSCPDTRINEFLALPEKYPKIARDLLQIIMAFSSRVDVLDANLDKYLNFVEKNKSYILNDQNFFPDFINSSRSMPVDNFEKFWILADRVVQYLRDDSIEYSNFFSYSAKLEDLYKNDFDAFENVIENMMNFTYQFSSSLGNNMEVNRIIVKSYLMFFGEEKFDEFLSGLKILLARAQDENYNLSDKNEKNFKARLKYIFPEYFVNVLKKDEKGQLIKSFKDDVDCVSLAYGISAIGFDLNQSECSQDYNINDLSGTDIFRKYFFNEKDDGQAEFLSGVLALIHEIRSGDINRVDALRKALIEMTESKDHCSGSIENILERVKKEALTVIEVQGWKNVMVLNTSDALVSDNWIFKANSSTQLAASSGALFFGLGLHKFSDDLHEVKIPEGFLEELPLDEEFKAFSRGEIKIKDILDAIIKKNLEAKLRENIQRAMPFVSSAIFEERIKSPGLMSVGTKIESIKTLKNEDFRFILDLAGFGDIKNTPFNLKHAGKSLVNPPLPSALEEKLLMYLFMMFGTVDPTKIDMQVTIGGRLSNENAGIVCASNILASDVSVQYADGAFHTDGHDWSTDVRIMVYDAGVRKKSLPYDVQANGRTDKIACRSFFDIKQLQLLGTFAVHSEFGGRFADEFEVYKDGFKALLKSHGLINAFHGSAWVSAKYNPYDPPEYHEKMIKSFTEARRDNEMLVAETRVLMARRLQAYLRDNRNRIISENPEEFERLKVY